MSEDKRRIFTLLKRLYAAIKSTNKNVSSIKEDNMVLLWENSSPGSAFAAQTIALDLTDYKWVKIESLPTVSTNGKNVTTNEFKCPGAGNTFAPTTRTDMGSSGWWHGGRTVEITTTGITFGQGGFRYSNTTTQTANDSYGIPLRIWGLKKSYSVSLVKDVLPAENGGTGVTSLEELKSKLGVISGGGGSGGGTGPLTLSDSRLLQTYLSLRNKELWSGAEWKTGTKTIPGISNYEKLLVFLWDGYNGIELSRVGSNMFRGGGFTSHVSSDAKIHTDVVMDLSFTEDDVVTIEYASLAGHITGGAHQAATDGWAIRIVGVEPTAAYVKEKLGISDTTIENGKVKFAPVKIENKVLLWTNPDFNAATFAKQTIDVPWQDYDAICVEYAYNPSGSKPYKDSCTVACPESGGSSVGHLEFLWLTTSGASNGAERYFTIKDGGIEFDTGWYGANNAAASTNNGFCIPFYIYGIKNKVTVDIPKVELSNFGGATVDPDKVITLKDYIVDEGTSGIWTYRKWNSGIAECWGRATNTTTLSTAWANNIYTGVLLDKLEYPFTFAEIPNEVVRLEPTNMSGWIYSENGTTTNVNTTTHTGKYMVARPSSSSATTTVKADIFVKGYWKALESGTTEVAAVKENTARLSIDMDGYEKSELVWTNPSPTTNFDPQTLTFDGVYDKLEVIFNYDVTYPERVGTQKAIVNDSDGTILNATWEGNATRRVIAKSANGKTTLEVQKGIRYISSAGDSNAVCIPYKIYGIQTTSKLEGTVTGDNITLDIGVNKAADLNPDTLIPSGADLDDYLDFGSYLSPNKENSASLVNCPHATSGFSLQVIKTSSGGKMQLLTSNAIKCLVYMRHWDKTFSDWVQMGRTVIKKVWENASPDSDFAGQTINLDLSGYTHLWIEYSGLPVCIVQKNVSTDCWSSTVPSLRYRSVIFTDTAVTFKDGGYITAYGGTQKLLNSALRPKIIRGIKGVL